MTENKSPMHRVHEAEVIALRQERKRLMEIIRAYRVTLAEFTGNGPSVSEALTEEHNDA